MADPTTINVVIDLSHHNGNPDLAGAKASGIAGVIHKATQGRSYLAESQESKNLEDLNRRMSFAAAQAGPLALAPHSGNSRTGPPTHSY